ncbi:MAG TPA: hypothetical protein DCP20_01875 [Coriobacteriia bacterium]|nr:MAG: RloB [Actinobacteria bacterium 66_15]HAL29448.1 hypothetical protein [Coriobacteriia bacterium]
MTARHRSPRGLADPSRDPARSLVIVTEGAETEVEYLKSLRRWFRFGPNVKVIGAGGDPCSIVETAATLHCDVTARRRHRIPDYVEFDEAWAVFDVESDPSRTSKVQKAIALARRCGVSVAASNPCFEFWLVLHLVDHIAPFGASKDVAKVLSNHFPSYSKSTPPPPTQENLTSATTRAALGRNHHRDGGGDGNPSTNMDHLIASLVKAASPTVSVTLGGLCDYDETDLSLVSGVKTGGAPPPR